MTTWTLTQVSQAERLFAKLVVDDSLIQRDPEGVSQAAADEMAKRLVRMAHPFGIELHRDDFDVQWIRNDATPWQVVGEMRWRPTTQEVELRGGHLDGQRYAIQKVGEPLRVRRPAATAWWSDGGDDSSAALVEITDTYELVGWREDERVWVYESRP